jgi:hypothetical protein
MLSGATAPVPEKAFPSFGGRFFRGLLKGRVAAASEPVHEH